MVLFNVTDKIHLFDGKYQQFFHGHVMFCSLVLNLDFDIGLFDHINRNYCVLGCLVVFTYTHIR